MIKKYLKIITTTIVITLFPIILATISIKPLEKYQIDHTGIDIYSQHVLPSKNPDNDIDTGRAYLGSCTANSTASAIEYESKKSFNRIIRISRLFTYYNERAILGTTTYDSGGTGGLALVAIEKFGFIDEEDYPYVQKDVYNAPSNVVYFLASRNSHKIYYFGITCAQIDAYVRNDDPVVVDLLLFDSCLQAEFTGKIPMPAKNENIVGGHSMLIVGYDNTDDTYILQNSWSDQWGNRGFCKVPKQYIRDYACDLYVVRFKVGNF